MWLGTCTMEKVRGGDIGSLSETNSSSSLPPEGPGIGRVPDVVCLHCRRFVHTQWVGGALTPSWQQGTEERAATCTGLCGPVLQTQHAMVYGALVCKGCHLVLNAAGSWRLVHVAASASAALTAAPGPRVQGASWNWTRWTKNKQSTLAPPGLRQTFSFRWKSRNCSVFSLPFATHTCPVMKVTQTSKEGLLKRGSPWRLPLPRERKNLSHINNH